MKPVVYRSYIGRILVGHIPHTPIQYVTVTSRPWSGRKGASGAPCGVPLAAPSTDHLQNAPHDTVALAPAAAVIGDYWHCQLLPTLRSICEGVNVPF